MNCQACKPVEMIFSKICLHVTQAMVFDSQPVGLKPRPRDVMQMCFPNQDWKIEECTLSCQSMMKGVLYLSVGQVLVSRVLWLSWFESHKNKHHPSSPLSETCGRFNPFDRTMITSMKFCTSLRTKTMTLKLRWNVPLSGGACECVRALKVFL